VGARAAEAAPAHTVIDLDAVLIVEAERLTQGRGKGWVSCKGDPGNLALGSQVNGHRDRYDKVNWFPPNAGFGKQKLLPN